jgi:hypothetical protein
MRTQNLILKIKDADTHSIVNIAINKNVIVIETSFNLHFADSVLTYELQEWNQDFPETFQVDSKVIIDLEDNSFEFETEVWDCEEMRKNIDSDFSWGYSFFHNFTTDSVSEFLEDMLKEMESFKLKKYNQPENVEVIFEKETDPHNSYHNQYFKIARKEVLGEMVYFYLHSDNHVAHNEHDYDGRSEWIRIDKFEDKHDGNSILDEFEEYFGEELESLLKKHGIIEKPKLTIQISRDSEMIETFGMQHPIKGNVDGRISFYEAGISLDMDDEEIHQKFIDDNEDKYDVIVVFIYASFYKQ